MSDQRKWTVMLRGALENTVIIIIIIIILLLLFQRLALFLKSSVFLSNLWATPTPKGIHSPWGVGIFRRSHHQRDCLLQSCWVTTWLVGGCGCFSFPLDL